ncbi:MAG: hypothetical protein Kow0063_04580 [Anaerolineae bacterium]
MSRRQWALVVVLILVNYIIFASLFNVVFSNRPGSVRPTRTPLPTFTSAPVPTPVVVAPTDTPVPPPPSPTPVVVTDTPTPTPLPATEPPATEQPPVAGGPSVTVEVNLNVRTGPGTNYERIGTLPEGTTVEIIGRVANSTWWQIPYADGPDGKGWISAGYGTATNTESVPVVEAPPPPSPAPPTATPIAESPPPGPTPSYQFTPLAWEGQWNAGLAQIRGIIRDAAGNTVNGVFVQAKCGSTVLASNPSGINLYAPGEPYEAGAYDIILSSPLSPDSMCNWEVRVVQANTFEEAKNPAAPALSPVGYCDLTWEQVSICFANWQKNW